jgi:HEAT repeat protein
MDRTAVTQCFHETLELTGLSDKAASTLLGALSHSQAGVRRRAISALAHWRATPQVREPLIEMLKDEDVEVRRAAVSVLRTLGFAAGEVARIARPLLGDTDALVRC